MKVRKFFSISSTSMGFGGEARVVDGRHVPVRVLVGRHIPEWVLIRRHVYGFWLGGMDFGWEALYLARVLVGRHIPERVLIGRQIVVLG